MYARDSPSLKAGIRRGSLLGGPALPLTKIHSRFLICVQNHTLADDDGFW